MMDNSYEQENTVPLETVQTKNFSVPAIWGVWDSEELGALRLETWSTRSWKANFLEALTPR